MSKLIDLTGQKFNHLTHFNNIKIEDLILETTKFRVV